MWITALCRYYADVSASVEDDDYFHLMMWNGWDLGQRPTPNPQAWDVPSHAQASPAKSPGSPLHERRYVRGGQGYYSGAAGPQSREGAGSLLGGFRGAGNLAGGEGQGEGPGGARAKGGKGLNTWAAQRKRAHDVAHARMLHDQVTSGEVPLPGHMRAGDMPWGDGARGRPRALPHPHLSRDHRHPEGT